MFRQLIDCRRNGVVPYPCGTWHTSNAAGAVPARQPPVAPVRQLRRRHSTFCGAENHSPDAKGHNPASGSQVSQAKPLADAALFLSSTLAVINREYLRVRRRTKWWSRVAYPKVPLMAESAAKQNTSLWFKVGLLGCVFFCASFNLTILQNLKDSIMVTAGGAETLPFLAAFCVLPASVAFFIVYGKMVAHLPERLLFIASLAPLLAFYILFAVILFPNAPHLHLHWLVESWLPYWPVGLHGLLKVLANWTYSLFFCFAELWGAVAISVLFWSLANEVCNIEEAKAVYPLMGISANVALVVGGMYTKAVSSTLGSQQLLLSLRVLVATVLLMSCVMFAAKWYIDQHVLLPARARAAASEAAALEDRQLMNPNTLKKKKAKGSIGESLAILRGSPKILNLSLLVMSYGLCHRLFEFAWKGQLRVLHPSMPEYQSVLADVSSLTGVCTIALMLLSRAVFQHWGWGVAASMTPLVLLATGVTFFICSMVTASSDLPAALLPTMVALGSAAGIITQVFARSSKFSLFDPAKEMVYIEMDKDEKSRGKAAVDLVGSQIGKSGASWMTQGLLLLTGSISGALPYTALCFTLIALTWIRATWGLHALMIQHEAQALAPAAGGPQSPADPLALPSNASSAAAAHVLEGAPTTHEAPGSGKLSSGAVAKPQVTSAMDHRTPLPGSSTCNGSGVVWGSSQKRDGKADSADWASNERMGSAASAVGDKANGSSGAAQDVVWRL